MNRDRLPPLTTFLMLTALAGGGIAMGGSGRPDFEGGHFEALPERPAPPPKPERMKPRSKADVARRKRRKAQREARRR